MMEDRSRKAKNELEFEAKVVRWGNSLSIRMTKEARAMGLSEGDYVRVRVRRLPTIQPPEGGWPRYRCVTFDGDVFEYEVRPRGSVYALYTEGDEPMGDFGSIDDAEAFIEQAYPECERI